MLYQEHYSANFHIEIYIVSLSKKMNNFQKKKRKKKKEEEQDQLKLPHLFLKSSF